MHIANVWGQGVDKVSFDERRKFTKEHLPQVLAVASDPLKCTWWHGAEKPWQCLAACFEVAGALSVRRGTLGGCCRLWGWGGVREFEVKGGGVRVYAKFGFYVIRYYQEYCSAEPGSKVARNAWRLALRWRELCS